MIETVQLTKKFASLTAVDSLSLEIPDGEIFGFIGPNGAGKTTTIKMMVGILPPSSGSVAVGGYDLQKEPLKAKKIIGYIPDIPYVYPYMTGREFLNFVAELYQVENKQNKISKYLDLFSLQGMIDGYFKDFSRGTKQKLTISAALLHQPEVLIIDEPILGLDPASSEKTLNLLKKFKEDGGTVFVCSHTLTVIQEICDRIGIIDHGEVIFKGPIDKLKKRLKTKEERLEKLFMKITQ
jgi:ABC-2 type transport system ATP-binding protein